ncbi:MAG: hypothetical protein U1E65_22675 [Myxococcota bacterium]
MSNTKTIFEAIQLATAEEWSLLHRVGKQVDAAEFAAFLEKGEVPAVALNRSEMATVRGGKKKGPYNPCKGGPGCPGVADAGGDTSGDAMV